MTPRWWEVGRLLPLLMAVLFGCEIASRFMPLDLVAFRTWEPAHRTSWTGPGWFTPGRVTVKRRAYGDLAAIGNLRRLRQYHDEELRIDPLGFRNADDLDRTSYGGIVLGDSFVVATAVSEAETLPGQLTGRAGSRFYNAGSVKPLEARRLASLATRLRISTGVVVFAMLERCARVGAQVPCAPDDFPEPPTLSVSAPEAPKLRLTEVITARLFSETPSPVRILSGKLVKWLQDDTLRPNPYA